MSDKIKQFTIALSQNDTIGLITSKTPVNDAERMVWKGITLIDNAYRVRKTDTPEHITAYSIVNDNKGDEWIEENPKFLIQVQDDALEDFEQIPVDTIIDEIDFLFTDQELKIYRNAIETCKESIAFFKEQAWG